MVTAAKYILLLCLESLPVPALSSEIEYVNVSDLPKDPDLGDCKEAIESDSEDPVIIPYVVHILFAILYCFSAGFLRILANFIHDRSSFSLHLERI